MKSVFELQQTIESELDGLENICFAPMTEAHAIPDISNCVVQSLFGYFGNSMETFDKVYEENGKTMNYLNHLDKCLGWVNYLMKDEIENDLSRKMNVSLDFFQIRMNNSN